MLSYHVEDMSCGHCVGSITRAIQALDPQARVAVDLAARRVTVDSAQASAEAVQQAISEAGYTPQPMVPAEPPPVASQAGGCGCGSGRSRCGS